MYYNTPKIEEWKKVVGHKNRERGENVQSGIGKESKEKKCSKNFKRKRQH